MDTVLEARAAGNSGNEFRGSSERKKLGIWLDDLVKRSAEKPISQIVKLTPILAEVLLDRNPANRKISPRITETFARDMAAGNWQFNGEPVIVAKSGELNDGQHRCSAVVMAGRAIDVILIVGVERETRMTLDRGRNRTVGDYLSMDGFTDTNVLGAAAGLFCAYRETNQASHGGAQYQRMTKSEILKAVADYPGLQNSVKFVAVKGADAAGGKSVLAFCHFVFRQIGRSEDADNFMYGILTDTGLRAGDPTLYVRNRLINERGKLRTGARVELIFRGWNAWRRGEKISRLLLQGGELPKLER